jgi:hypothetical protein
MLELWTDADEVQYIDWCVQSNAKHVVVEDLRHLPSSLAQQLVVMLNVLSL